MQLRHKQELNKCKVKSDRRSVAARHENELQAVQERQKQELFAVTANSGESDQLSASPEGSPAHGGMDDVSAFYRSPQPISKSQKRKQQRQQASDLRAVALETSRAELSTVKNAEKKSLEDILNKEQLLIYPIPSDGHCMFRAVEHQLEYINYPKRWNYKDLRVCVGKYLQAHQNALEAFFQGYGEDDTHAAPSDTYLDHCQKIMVDAWGGELELNALTRILNLPISVYSAKPPHILRYAVDQEETADQSIVRLTFHQHQYAAGPHYNSVISSRSTPPSES